MEKHYTLLKAAELLGVTTQTIRNWDNSGKIRTVRTPGNQRRIPESEIARITGSFISSIIETENKPQRTIVEISKDSERIEENTEKTSKRDENQKETIINNTETYSEAIVKAPVIISKEKDKYLLMCKDTEVYDIEKSQILNESLLPGCILNKTKDFKQWMQTRYSTDTNFSAQRLIQHAFGTFDIEHAAYETGAFSLSDCYWLKKVNDNVSFNEITPYIHKEWDGTDAYGIQNDYIWGSLSNLFISGKLDKRWINAQELLKVNTFNEIEPYKLCSSLILDNTAKTHLTNEGLIIKNFTTPDVFYESMEQSGMVNKEDDSRNTAIDYFREDAIALFVIDYLTENNDRHPDDYGFLRDSNTGEHLRMAPYYNFDRIWSGHAISLPDIAWREYREYIHDLCTAAINVAKEFEYGTIIERRAVELLQNQGK